MAVESINRGISSSDYSTISLSSQNRDNSQINNSSSSDDAVVVSLSTRPEENSEKDVESPDSARNQVSPPVFDKEAVEINQHNQRVLAPVSPAVNEQYFSFLTSILSNKTLLNHFVKGVSETAKEITVQNTPTQN